MSGLIKSWSPSRLFDYEQCPLKVKFIVVDNLCPHCFEGKMQWVDGGKSCEKCGQSEETSEALARGNRIHKSAEQYITGRLNKFIPELEKYRDWLDYLRAEYRARRVRVECMLAVDRNWKPVVWKDKAAYCRTKIDVMWMFEEGQVCIIDWKSGKLKKNGEYGHQLNNYSVMSLSCGHGVAAQAQLYFTDYNPDEGIIEREEGTVTIEDLPEHQAKWDKRVKAMLSDEFFVPRPGYYCSYCPFSRNKGGPCEY